jgi:hypothetical protein
MIDKVCFCEAREGCSGNPFGDFAKSQRLQRTARPERLVRFGEGHAQI